MDPAATSDVSMAAYSSMLVLKLVCGYAVCAFLGALSFTLLWMIWKGKLDLSSLLSEVNGQASVSRFQLIVFTLIIALSLFVLTIQDGQFPEISAQILILLGISSSTYAVGKAIAYSQPGVLTSQGEQQTVKDISATGAAVIATPGGIAAAGAAEPIPPTPPQPQQGA